MRRLETEVERAVKSGKKSKKSHTVIHAVRVYMFRICRYYASEKEEEKKIR